MRMWASGWNWNNDEGQPVEGFCILPQVWREGKNRLGTVSKVFCGTYSLEWKLFFLKTIEIVFWKVMKTAVSNQIQREISVKQVNF